MAGFLKRLFGLGGSSGDAGAGQTSDGPVAETHKGVDIRLSPIREADGQFRVAGTLTRDGKTRRFLRADLLASRQAAEEASLAKAKLIIDQNGESLWAGDASGPC